MDASFGRCIASKRHFSCVSHKPKGHMRRGAAQAAPARGRAGRCRARETRATRAPQTCAGARRQSTFKKPAKRRRLERLLSSCGYQRITQIYIFSHICIHLNNDRCVAFVIRSTGYEKLKQGPGQMGCLSDPCDKVCRFLCKPCPAAGHIVNHA
eukprot:6202991-Pleurochrysis_carterae.AAC.2